MVKQPLFVTCAIIRDGDRYLITQRPDDNKRDNGGRWEFPGGKLKFGESPRESLKREIFEEIGINIKVEDLVEIASNVYRDDLHVVLVAFRCIYLGGTIQKKDISDFKWLTVEEMDDYDITEADHVFVKKLKHYSYFP